MLNATNYQGDAIKPTLSYHLIPVKMDIIKKRKRVGKYVEKLEPLYTLGGNSEQYI